jgi:hypothetical protein
VTVDLLLHPAADLVDRGRAELDHVEGVEHRGRVLELVIDGVPVAVERIQGGDLHAVAEPFATLLEPVAVGLSGASGHKVEQSCSGLAIGVGGQVDHAGQLLGPRPPSSMGLTDTWCHTCSSTPSQATPANRAWSSAIVFNSG